MPPYKIQPHTLERAKELGLNVQPSSKKKYKIEVYDGTTGDFLFYGGDSNYSDYPNYILTHGKAFADTRRRLYYKRHHKEISQVGSRGSIIAYLLW